MMRISFDFVRSFVLCFVRCFDWDSELDFIMF